MFFFFFFFVNPKDLPSKIIFQLICTYVEVFVGQVNNFEGFSFSGLSLILIGENYFAFFNDNLYMIEDNNNKL